MKKIGFHITWESILILLSVFLITAGLSRYIETDSGNILIHDIEVESVEGWLYGARLFRSLQATSMDRRPSILLFFGESGNRYTGDHIAMEFAKRGFVVLTIEESPQDISVAEPPATMENPIDSGYTFLTTRFFTDPYRTGLIAYDVGTETAITGEHFNDFTIRALISPENAIDYTASEATRNLYAKYETAPAFIPANKSNATAFTSSHAGMIFHHSVIEYLLEQFQEALAIPNDSPFWFSASSQTAQLLLLMRAALLVLLLIICCSISAILTGGKIRTISGTILGIIIFLLISAFFNNFLISIRLGSPYHYIPDFENISAHFSWKIYILTIAACVLFSLSIRNRMLADYTVLVLGCLCLFGFIPVLFGSNSGWEILHITHLRWRIVLSTIYTLLYCLLMRIGSQKPFDRTCKAVMLGIIYAMIFCCLPAAVFA